MHLFSTFTPDFVYAIGGKNETGSLRSVEQYYIEKDMWGNVTSLSSPRYDHAAATVGETVGYLYLELFMLF